KALLLRIRPAFVRSRSPFTGSSAKPGLPLTGENPGFPLSGSGLQTRPSCLDARRPGHERSTGGLWAERTDRTADRDWRWYGWAPRPGVRARPSPVIAPSGPAGAGHYRPDGSRAAGSPGRGGWRL